MKDTEQKLKEIIASTLNINPLEINETFSQETSAEWTSILHITLILSVEEAFKTSFTENDLVQLTSYSKIKNALLNKA